MNFANQHSLVKIEKVSGRYKRHIERLCKNFQDLAVIKSKENYICASLVNGYVRLLILPPVNRKYKDREDIYSFKTIWDKKISKYLDKHIISTLYLIRGYKRNSLIDQYNRLIKKEQDLFGWSIVRVNTEKFEPYYIAK